MREFEDNPSLTGGAFRSSSDVRDFRDGRDGRDLRNETDAERTTREELAIEETALDRLEDQENERKRKELRNALRPHVKDEIARMKLEGQPDIQIGSETAVERQARERNETARSRTQRASETVAEREARLERERGFETEHANETPAERDARHARFRPVADETVAERDARHARERGE
jgi:Tfp pilus assembly major pilin PilA